MSRYEFSPSRTALATLGASVALTGGVAAAGELPSFTVDGGTYYTEQVTTVQDGWAVQAHERQLTASQRITLLDTTVPMAFARQFDQDPDAGTVRNPAAWQADLDLLRSTAPSKGNLTVYVTGSASPEYTAADTDADLTDHNAENDKLAIFRAEAIAEDVREALPGVEVVVAGQEATLDAQDQQDMAEARSNGAYGNYQGLMTGFNYDPATVAPDIREKLNSIIAEKRSVHVLAVQELAGTTALDQTCVREQVIDRMVTEHRRPNTRVPVPLILPFPGWRRRNAQGVKVEDKPAAEVPATHETTPSTETVTSEAAAPTVTHETNVAPVASESVPARTSVQAAEQVPYRDFEGRTHMVSPEELRGLRLRLTLGRIGLGGLLLGTLFAGTALYYLDSAEFPGLGCKPANAWLFGDCAPTPEQPEIVQPDPASVCPPGVERVENITTRTYLNDKLVQTETTR